MDVAGFTATEAKTFLEGAMHAELATTSHYWEMDETEEAMNLMIEAVGKLIEANNKKVASDIAQEMRMARYR